LPEHLLVLVIEADAAPGAELMNSRRSMKAERMASRQERAEPRQRAHKHRGVLELDGPGGS
jgi:hypothetical protein